MNGLLVNRYFDFSRKSVSEEKETIWEALNIRASLNDTALSASHEECSSAPLSVSFTTHRIRDLSAPEAVRSQEALSRAVR